MATVMLYFVDEELYLREDLVTVNVGVVNAYTYDEAKSLAKSMAKDMVGSLEPLTPKYMEVEFEYLQTGNIIVCLDD